MSETLADLRSMSYKELIERHDKLAQNTQVGIKHYQTELIRRDQNRETEAMIKLTKWIMFMTAAVLLLTFVGIVFAFFTFMK
ncbi:MAG: hypothetical protein ACYC6Z_10865 [Thermoleophilia bacterium]